MPSDWFPECQWRPPLPLPTPQLFGAIGVDDVDDRCYDRRTLGPRPHKPHLACFAVGACFFSRTSAPWSPGALINVPCLAFLERQMTHRSDEVVKSHAPPHGGALELLPQLRTDACDRFSQNRFERVIRFLVRSFVRTARPASYSARWQYGVSATARPSPVDCFQA